MMRFINSYPYLILNMNNYITYNLASYINYLTKYANLFF